MDSQTLIIICMVICIVTLIVLLTNSKPDNEVAFPEPEKADQEIELSDKFYMGEYRSGLPDYSEKVEIVYCGVTEDDFVFQKGTKGVKIGRIPRDGIKSVRVAGDGKNSSVIIRWQCSNSIDHESVFVFLYKQSRVDAEAAAGHFTTWLKERQVAATA